MLLTSDPRRLPRGRQPFPQLRQLDGLCLIFRLHVCQSFFEVFGLGRHLIQLAFQFIDRLRGVHQFALCLGGLFAGSLYYFSYAALCRLHRLVVQFHGKRRDAIK